MSGRSASGPEADRRTAQRDRADARADRERAAAHLARAYRDDLTGVLTRRPGRECLERAIARAQAAPTPLTLAYADVDGLKAANDQQGHASGDRLLHAVGRALLDNLRPYDIVIRYGGDEFVCALIDCSPETAVRTMDRVLEQLSQHEPPGRLSVGYAHLRVHDTLDRLLARADKAMYRSRQAARAPLSHPPQAWPDLSCLTCSTRMELQLDVTTNTPRPSCTASCPSCRHRVLLSGPRPPLPQQSRPSTDHHPHRQEVARMTQNNAPVVIWSSEDPRYDGHWSPQTRGATKELAVLIPELEAHLRRAVTRATLSMSEWSADQPRRLVIGGHLVRVGWFPQLRPHTATFGHSSGPRLVLDIRQGTPEPSDARVTRGW